MAVRRIEVVSGAMFVDDTHTLEEWQNKYGDSDCLWSFPCEELHDGTIEPNPTMIYWKIGDRYYETEEEV